MNENVMIAVVSVLAGLLVGYLVWGATTAWGSSQPRLAMMGMGGSMMGPGMMNGMMGGMMGQGMMNQPNHNHQMMGDMNAHMAQCHQMMGSMMSMMQPQSK